MPRWEAVQIASGLAIPFLLLPHIVNTRFAHTVFGVQDTYLYELKRLWPDSAALQSLLLLLVWTHGCIGIHHWLRLSEGYKQVRPLLVAVAAAVPILALAGFAVAGRETGVIMSDQEAFAALKARSNWPDDVESAVIANWRNGLRIGFAAILCGLAGILFLQWTRQKVTRSRVRVTYADGKVAEIEPGQTLLEASRAAGIPHASVCGGRARCSTCRVRIEQGLATLAPPTGAEAITLRSIDAPKNVRLACQVRPRKPLTISLVSAPGTLGPVQLEFFEVKEVIAAHASAQVLGQLVEFECEDSAALEGWLRSRTKETIALPHVDSTKARLLGGRLDYIRYTSVAVAVYLVGGEMVSLFVSPKLPMASDMVRATRHGYRVLGWVENDCQYFVVAGSASVDLNSLDSSSGGIRHRRASSLGIVQDTHVTDETVSRGRAQYPTTWGATAVVAQRRRSYERTLPEGSRPACHKAA